MKFIDDPALLRDLIKPGATIVLHSGCAEPSELTRVLTTLAKDVDGLRLITFMPMGTAPYVSPSLRVSTFFPGKGLRKAAASGQAELLRYPLSRIPALFDRNELVADLLLLKVSPPDEQGRMTLGISVDFMRAALRQNPIVVAEIDPRMPRTCGNTILLPEQVDYALESLGPPEAIDSGPATDIDQRIAKNVAGLVRDGAIIQTGIGALPDLVLGQLGHLSDLGIHTGIVTDATMNLMRSGAVTNATKTDFRGKCVTTIAAGSQAFYDYLNDNEAIEFHPCSLTHDRNRLAKIDGLFAVNSVLEIDLSGRANAERIDGRIIAGPGGLPDFAMGASRAKGGTSLIALRSTSPKGERSNIRIALGPDAPVSIDAEHIDYVVTEFGAAHLRGRSAAERAKALIAIAHPDWQAALAKG